MTDRDSIVDVNVALCRAVGLDPTDGIVAFTIDVEKDRYPLVTVTRRQRTAPHVGEDTTTAYKLVPVEEIEAE